MLSTVILSICIPYALSCIPMIPTIDPPPTTTTSAPSTNLCQDCTPGSFYDETYECDDAGIGMTCTVVPKETAFSYNTDNGCLQAVMTCPVGSDIAFETTDFKTLVVTHDEYTALEADISCDRTDGKSWVIQLPDDTIPILTKFTCYTKVSCAGCPAPTVGGTCPVGFTCGDFQAGPNVTPNQSGCAELAVQCDNGIYVFHLTDGSTIILTGEDLLGADYNTIGTDCVNQSFTLTVLAQRVFYQPIESIQCASQN